MSSNGSTDAPVQISNPPGALRPGPGHLGEVLLADDDPAAAASLAAVLRRAGFRVRVAGTGREALRQLCTRRVDLVITDIVMPEMDGLDLLRGLRGMQMAVPAIALSGDGPDAGALYAKAALCLGANLVLAKPVPPAVVLSAAHRLTGPAEATAAGFDSRAPAA